MTESDDKAMLKECPFCGSNDLGTSSVAHCSTVICRNCDGCMQRPNATGAFKAWNTRASQQSRQPVGDWWRKQYQKLYEGGAEKLAEHNVIVDDVETHMRAIDFMAKAALNHAPQQKQEDIIRDRDEWPDYNMPRQKQPALTEEEFERIIEESIETDLMGSAYLDTKEAYALLLSAMQQPPSLTEDEIAEIGAEVLKDNLSGIMKYHSHNTLRLAAKSVWWAVQNAMQRKRG